MPTHTAEAEGGIPGYRDHHSTSGSLRGIADGEGLGGFAAQEGERMPALVGGCRVDDDVGRADHTLQFCCRTLRSEEHTSELQSLMRNSYAVFCLNNTIKISTSIEALV